MWQLGVRFAVSGVIVNQEIARETGLVKPAALLSPECLASVEMQQTRRVLALEERVL